jgi:hypothetical protein
MVALISRVFMNEALRWTLEATCSECLTETIAPLIIGAPIDCAGCGVAMKIDPRKTDFHRSTGAGRASVPMRRARWGRGLLRALPSGRA